MSTTGWTIAGTDIRTLALQVLSVDGWAGFPGKRGAQVQIPHRHGAITTPKKFYMPMQFALAVVILPYSTTGTVTHAEGELGHIQENLDTLLGLLHSDSLISVVKSVPASGGGTENRTALCEVLDVIPVSKHRGITREIVIPFQSPDPFWRGTLVNDDANAGSFSINPGGNAPVADWVLTLKGGTDQRLTFPGSLYVEMSGAAPAAGFEIDAAARTITNLTSGNPADNLFSRTAEWPELAPNVSNSLTLTGGGTVDVDYYPKYLS
jgi:hypothetical protein